MRHAAPGQRVRPLLAVSVVAAVLALTAVVSLWMRTRPSVQTSVERTTAPPGPVSPADCPMSLSCLTVPARPAVVAAVRAAFSGAELLDSLRVVDEIGRSFSENVRVRTTEQVIVSVNARCIPGADAVPDRVLTSGGRASSKITAVVVGGRRGCSVSVVVLAPRGVTAPADAATALARQSVLQITG